MQTAFAGSFGKRAKYPRFKSRKKSRRSAAYTTSGFRFRDGQLTLAKMDRPLDIVWSRPLPEGAFPSTVTVSRDSAGRWFVSMLCEDPGVRPLPAADAAVGIDVGLDHLLTLSTGEKIANPRHAVDRFFPSSRLCSACGVLAESMPLSVRTWTCVCGTTHDRDVNAAKNLLAAGLAASACGAGVRPQRRSPDGQSATKQRTSQREP